MSTNARRVPAQQAAPEMLDAHCRSAVYRRALIDLLMFAAQRDVPILIEGESGTGKSTLARRIHECSPRRDGPFHRLSLAEVPDSLAEVALFGSVEGAYTGAPKRRLGAFASANGGTLLLDEFGKASRRVQYLLLQAIETGTIYPVGSDRELSVDVRIIVATSTPMDELVRDGQLEHDLAQRVKYFSVVLPPLRMRRKDIPYLVREMIEQEAPRRGYESIPSVEHDLMKALQDYEWPGNLRELHAVVVLLLLYGCGATTLTVSLCRDKLERLLPAMRRGGKQMLLPVEDAMRATEGNKSAAARLSGVSRSTFLRRLDRSKPDSGGIAEL